MPTNAFASDWQIVVNSNDGRHWFVDMDSIGVSGDYRYVWIKYELDDEDAEIWDGANRVVVRQKIHCVNRIVRVLEVISYNNIGKNVGSANQPDVNFPSGFDAIVPDSNIDIVANKVCAVD